MEANDYELRMSEIDNGISRCSLSGISRLDVLQLVGYGTLTRLKKTDLIVMFVNHVDTSIFPDT